MNPMSMALLGGLMIGLASSILLVGAGRIAGVSGISSHILEFKKGDTFWRILFLVGLVLGGFIFSKVFPEKYPLNLDLPTWKILLGGFLVGLGSSLGNGCTSGHGVCGVARGSKRSLVATLVFIGTAVLTVWLLRVLI